MRGFAAVRLAGGGVVGAGFALPRDAGPRPIRSKPSAVRFCSVGDAWVRSRQLAGGGVVGAGFALPRDAGPRPALQAVGAILLGWRCVGSQPSDWRGAALSVRVSRSRAMPVGDRRSTGER